MEGLSRHLEARFSSLASFDGVFRQREFGQRVYRVKASTAIKAIFQIRLTILLRMKTIPTSPLRSHLSLNRPSNTFVSIQYQFLAVTIHISFLRLDLSIHPVFRRKLNSVAKMRRAKPIAAVVMVL